MSNKKRYRVEHNPTMGSIILEIDFDFIGKISTDKGDIDWKMEQKIKDMVDFWADSGDKLKDNNFDYFQTFLKQLCGRVIGILGELNLNEIGIIDYLSEQEGYCKLDGTDGITLLYVDKPEFGIQDDYEITELKEVKNG